ncbi:MAG TPA: hypothetical protein VNZ85_05455 [Caulobacter sp.]|nr:hypothetical protein [Caulobacter sp.]
MLAFSRFQRDFFELAPEIRTVDQAEFRPLCRTDFTAGKRRWADLKAKEALEAVANSIGRRRACQRG